VSLPPLLVYSALRLTAFALAVGLAWLVGLRGFPLLLVALFVSASVSFFALSRQRDAVSASIVARRDRIASAMAERTRVEDEWDDAERGQRAAPTSPGEPSNHSGEQQAEPDQ
jgi:hypothetical protein